LFGSLLFHSVISKAYNYENFTNSVVDTVSSVIINIEYRIIPMLQELLLARADEYAFVSNAVNSKSGKQVLTIF